MSSIELPKYVQDIFSEIAIENGFSDFTVKVNQGKNPGDGYSSELLSITITENISDNQIDLVCKFAPFDEMHRKEFLSNLSFEHEALFYSMVVPIFTEFQDEKNIPKQDQFLSFPKCYATRIDDENERYVIVLEDLRPSGFKMWNKAEPSPIENVRLAMSELGKFHGLSIAMKDQKPEEFAAFRAVKDIFKQMFRKESLRTMFDSSFDHTLKSLKNEKHKTMMKHVKSNFLEYLDDCLDDEAHFGVLAHGDCWNNNMLFQFNESGVAESVRFLDWQALRYGSPAIDILYNIFTSTDKAFRDKEYDNMLKCYYDSLSKMVKLLGSNPDELFTFENLTDELKRCGNYTLLVAPIIIHTVQADSSDIVSPDKTSNGSADGSNNPELVTKFSETGQSKFDARINELFEDIVKFGFYHEVN